MNLFQNTGPAPAPTVAPAPLGQNPGIPNVGVNAPPTPPVAPPVSFGPAGGGLTPEQQLQQAQNMNYMPPQPQIVETPGGGAQVVYGPQPPQSAPVTPQQGQVAPPVYPQQPPAQQPPYGQPQMPAQGQAPAQNPYQAPAAPPPQGNPYEVNVADYPGVDHGILEELLTEAQSMNVPADQVPHFLNQSLQEGAGNFSDVETYREYGHKQAQLMEALETKYGDKAEDVLGQIFANVKSTSPALFEKVLTDPAMLEPEIIMDFMEGGSGAENPYLKHLGHVSSKVPAAPEQPQNAPFQGASGPAGGLAQLQNPSDIYRPENRHLLNNPAVQKERLNAVIRQRMAHAQNFVL